MKTLVLLLAALPCAAKPVDAERLSKLLGFHGQAPEVRVQEPATPAPFRLLGTLRGAHPLVAIAAASRVITATIGDLVLDAKILSIERTEITIQRNGRVERVTFASVVGPPSGSSAGRVTRRFVEQQFENPAQVMKQVRIAPIFQGGKWAGFKALSVEPGSTVERLGLHTGDIIRSINGRRLQTPEDALEFFVNARTLRRFDVELERDGQRLSQTLTIDE